MTTMTTIAATNPQTTVRGLLSQKGLSIGQIWSQLKELDDAGMRSIFRELWQTTCLDPQDDDKYFTYRAALAEMHWRKLDPGSAILTLVDRA